MSEKVKKAAVVLKALLGYGSYLLLNLCFAIYVLIVFVLTLPCPKLRRILISKFLTRAARLQIWFLDIFGVASFEVRGRENISDGKTVYVANHGSSLDPIILLASIPNAGILLKYTYSSLLVIWLLVRIFDFIPVEPNNLASLGGAREACKKLLERMHPLIIFPEGTRSRTGRLQDFMNLAFRLARESGAEIRPVAIYQKGSLLTKFENPILPLEKNRFYVSFLPPISPDEAKNAAALSDLAYSAIKKELAALSQNASLKK